jgi:hypothetical protein
MRSRLVAFLFSLYLAVALIGCTSKPSPDNNNPDNNNPSATGTPADQATPVNAPKEAKKSPIVVPAGTTITVSLGSALGSKLSKPDQTFSASVAKSVMVENVVAIPQGTTVNGTVTDAKPLGKFAGGAVLQLRIDSITVKGKDMPVEAALRTFSAKGKGKRTAVITGGGAALGGIIGGLAGGGKGAAIGALAGGGAGAGGSALTGNKDIVLPAEATVSFQLTQPLDIRR